MKNDLTNKGSLHWQTSSNRGKGYVCRGGGGGGGGGGASDNFNYP